MQGLLLSKTLKEKGFDGVFTEVSHSESLGLKNPNELRIFHLDVVNNAFAFDSFYSFLLKNIGQYVFSRAKIDQFKLDDEVEVVGAKAISLLRKAANSHVDWIGEELGDILLYIFLEQILGAPKLFSKLELLEYGNFSVINGGSVHLLPLGGDAPAYQMVFGKSRIVGDIQDAIDTAFVTIEAVQKNVANEMRLVESTVLSQSFDPATADQLKQIVVPNKNKGASHDKAFGVFLGYSLGLNPENFSNSEFREAIKSKMDTDIKAHVSYISSKIKAANLGTHSFYFYILPFNDAAAEKQSIMNALLEGGV